MARVIRMPRLSDTMDVGNIVEWHVKEGDKIEAGDVLAEVETDKATMEVESFFDGTILHIAVGKGEVPVNAVIAVMGKEGEDYKEALKKAQAENGGSTESTEGTEASGEKSSSDEDKAPKEADDAAKEEKVSDGQSSATESQDPSTSSSDRIKASPLAKAMAAEKGIDLSTVKGTGDGGRIIKRDIENYKPSAASGAPSYATPAEAYTDIPLTQMRKTIARRLAESKFQAPHFYLTVEVDMDNIVQERKEINTRLKKQGIKLSFNDFVLKATAMALAKHPEVNASWMGDKIRQHHVVNLGVAVAVEDGLLVPVVRNAAALPMTEINRQVIELAGKASEKKLALEEMQGNTFTVSNLGMFGIEEFTAIINPPDACILAVGAIKEKAVVKNGELATGHRMKMTLSCDHRVVDGATGAQFLQTLQNMLELPSMMMV